MKRPPLSPSGGSGRPLRRMALGLALGVASGLIIKDLNLPALLSYWKPRAPVVVGIALGFAILGLTPLRKLLAVATAGLAALWLAAAFTPLAASLVPRVVRADPLADADAIFVFSSSLQIDGDPSAAAMARLERGFELLAERRAPRLIVSELPPPYDQHAALARKWQPHWNAAGEILAVGPVLNTHDEAVAVARLCLQHGWKRVIAVTSPTHARRAAAALEHAGQQQGLQVLAAPSVETRFDLEHLNGPGASDDRLTAFAAVLHDVLGGWLYRLRGWSA